MLLLETRTCYVFLSIFDQEAVFVSIMPPSCERGQLTCTRG